MKYTSKEHITEEDKLADMTTPKKPRFSPQMPKCIEQELYEMEESEEQEYDKKAKMRDYLGFGPKVRECIIPSSQWNGDTGIDRLLKTYRQENLWPKI